MSSLEKQEGGVHYKNLAIQPIEFIEANNIPFLEGCVIKRMCRHENKDGIKDLDKAIHEIGLIKDLRYKKESEKENSDQSWDAFLQEEWKKAVESGDIKQQQNIMNALLKDIFETNPDLSYLKNALLIDVSSGSIDIQVDFSKVKKELELIPELEVRDLTQEEIDELVDDSDCSSCNMQCSACSEIGQCTDNEGCVQHEFEDGADLDSTPFNAFENSDRSEYQALLEIAKSHKAQSPTYSGDDIITIKTGEGILQVSATEVWNAFIEKIH